MELIAPSYVYKKILLQSESGQKFQVKLTMNPI